jgi:hypothetical protein
MGKILTHAKFSARVIKAGNSIGGPYYINDRFLSATDAGFQKSTSNSFVQTITIKNKNSLNNWLQQTT